MQITSGYGVEIKKQNIPIRHTLRIYRSAVSYLIRVYAESWEELSQIDNTQKRFNAAEQWFVIRETTASVCFRQERDITVICQPRIISVHDILSGNY